MGVVSHGYTDAFVFAFIGAAALLFIWTWATTEDKS